MPDAAPHLEVRRVRPEDRDAWLAMRRDFWPGSGEEEVDDFLARGRFAPFAAAAVFIAVADGGAVSFAEASARPYADGCETSPVGYLEGWYVAPDWRRRGVGRALLDAVKNWARRQGFTELASDAEIENSDSAAAHEALGFQEAGRAILFATKL